MKEERSTGILQSIYEFLDEPKRGRMILIALLILGSFFAIFYYSSLGDAKIRDQVSLPIDEYGQSSETHKDETPQDFNVFITEIENFIKKTNIEEIQKIKDFVNIKANRTATLELLNEAMENKTNYYSILKKNEDSLSSDDYKKLEDKIIESAGMTKEFLKAFESKTTVKDLKILLEKYENN